MQLRAALLGLALAACTGGDPTQVRVHARSFTGDGAPDLAAQVLFYDPGGALLARSGVDASGDAAAELPAGAQVVVVQTPVAGATRLTVIRGVQPGDVLEVGLRAFVPAPGHRTQVQVTVPPMAGPPGRLTLFGACAAASGDGGGALTLDALDACRADTVPMLAVLDAGPSGVFHRFDPAVPVNEGTATLQGTWAQGPRTPLTVHIPAELGPQSFVASRAVILDAHGTMAWEPDQRPPIAATTEVAFALPPQLGVQALASASLRWSLGWGLVEAATSRPADRALTIDFADRPLRLVTSPVAIGDVGLTWTESATGGAGDARVTTLFSALVGSSPPAVRFDLVDDGVQPSVPLPDLPDDLASLDPRRDPAAGWTGAAMYLDVGSLDGYDAARGDAFAWAHQPDAMLRASGTGERVRRSINWDGAPIAP